MSALLQLDKDILYSLCLFRKADEGPRNGHLKGLYDAISSFAFFLECYKLIDKIPGVAKTKVSKPKRCSL